MALRDRENNYCSTGNLLSEEIELNLYMKVFLETESSGTKKSKTPEETDEQIGKFGSFIGCTVDISNQHQRAIEAIRILRESRTGYDDVVDAIGREYK